MGIPRGKALQSTPFEFDGSKFVMMNNGHEDKDSFAVYLYSMGGPGGTPLSVHREGRWRSYFNKDRPVTDPREIAIYDKVASTIRAKDYARISKSEGALE